MSAGSSAWLLALALPALAWLVIERLWPPARIWWTAPVVPPSLPRLLPVLASLLLPGCPSPDEGCGEAEVVDEDTGTCVPARCGSSRWPASEHLGDSPVFVAEWGDDDWDGSRDRPFASPARGVEAARDDGGGAVAIAAGLYPVEALNLGSAEDGIDLVGRCAELVSLWAYGRATGAIRVADQGLNRLRGLTVEGPGYGIYGFTSGKTLELDEVVVRSDGVAVFLQGSQQPGTPLSTLSLVDSALLGGSRGVFTWGSASVVASESRLEGGWLAFEVSGGSGWTALPEVVVEDSEVSGGMAVASVSRMRVRRSVVRQAEWGIIVAWSDDLELEDVEIRDFVPIPTSSYGIYAQNGAVLVARRLLIEGAGHAGVVVTGAGTEVLLEDSWIRDTDRSYRPGSGQGLVVQEGGHLEGTDLSITGSAGPGVFAESGGTVLLRDSLVEGSDFAGAVVLDGGLSLEGVDVVATRVSAESSGGVGVFAWDVAGQPVLLLEDVSLGDLPAAGLYLRGQGIYRVLDSRFERSGAAPWLTGGVVATGGIQRWSAPPMSAGDGLLLMGNSFVDLPADAVLLDGSSATLVGNEFEGIGQAELRWQRCDGVEEPLVSGADAPDCQDQPQPLEPLLSYETFIDEIDLVE